MQVDYFCDCGKQNTIEMKRRPKGGKPALFYCTGCGKPSYDVCTKCQHLSDVGSEHQWCQACGAPSEALRRGIAVVDVLRNFWGAIWALISGAAMVGVMLYIAQRYFVPWVAKLVVENSRFYFLSNLALLVLMFLCATVPVRWVPFYTLLTGQRKPPVSVRALSRCGFVFSHVYEQELIESALNTRTRIKFFCRKHWRKMPPRFRAWVHTSLIKPLRNAGSSSAIIPR